MLLVGKNKAEQWKNEKIKSQLKSLMKKELELLERQQDRELRRIEFESEIRTRFEKTGKI